MIKFRKSKNVLDLEKLFEQAKAYQFSGNEYKKFECWVTEFTQYEPKDVMLVLRVMVHRMNFVFAKGSNKMVEFPVVLNLIEKYDYFEGEQLRFESFLESCLAGKFEPAFEVVLDMPF